MTINTLLAGLVLFTMFAALEAVEFEYNKEKAEFEATI